MSKTRSNKTGNNFHQFIVKEDKGARLKEKIRQEKKKVRLQTKEFFAEQKRKFRGEFTPETSNESSRGPNQAKGSSRQSAPANESSKRFSQPKRAQSSGSGPARKPADRRPAPAGGRPRSTDQGRSSGSNKSSGSYKKESTFGRGRNNEKFNSASTPDNKKPAFRQGSATDKHSTYRKDAPAGKDPVYRKDSTDQRASKDPAHRKEAVPGKYSTYRKNANSRKSSTADKDFLTQDDSTLPVYSAGKKPSTADNDLTQDIAPQKEPNHPEDLTGESTHRKSSPAAKATAAESTSPRPNRAPDEPGRDKAPLKPIIRKREANPAQEDAEGSSRAYNQSSDSGAYSKPSKKEQRPSSVKPVHKNAGIKPAGPSSNKNAVSAEPGAEQKSSSDAMPLNKFIAHAGISSRRDAAEIVRSGRVWVNGQAVTEPGFKVSEKDDIRVQGKKVSARKHLVYILLNKPKDHITTTEDPEGRKTVMDIVRKATPERVYPVGRLDRNTTGVLILTNDGELAQKLSHPSYQVRKIYEVTLDRPLLKKDFDALLNGLTLEDGFIAPDSLAYADAKDKKIVGIEIHSGRNRIVRRMFETLGYDVRNLDRVMYANLTKKNVERGKWRFLMEKEIRLLKFMNASYARKH